MAKITKPDMTYVWASGGSKTAPSSVKIQTGWIVEKPEFEKMNWVQNSQDGSLAYLFQMGVPEWDSAVEYQYSATYRSYVQRNGLVYKALQVGTNKDPASEAAYWTLAFDDKGAAATVQSNLATHITNYGTLASLSNAATARTNLDVYSKGEGDARYAALAGLDTQTFSVADGSTSKQAVNKGQLDTKAPVAGNAAQEFAVAAATTGNSAVNKTQFDLKTGLATDTVAGIVEKALAAELTSGTANKFPDALTILGGLTISSGTNGYIKLPTWMGGFTIQWGVAFVSLSATASVNYPIAFTTVHSVVMTMAGASFTAQASNYIDTITTTSFNLTNKSPSSDANFNWIAIGVV